MCFVEFSKSRVCSPTALSSHMICDMRRVVPTAEAAPSSTMIPSRCQVSRRRAKVEEYAKQSVMDGKDIDWAVRRHNAQMICRLGRFGWQPLPQPRMAVKRAALQARSLEERLVALVLFGGKSPRELGFAFCTCGQNIRSTR